jgi:hypothetical protein
MLSHSCPAGRRWNGYGRVGRGAGTEQGQDRGRVLFRGEPRITLLLDVISGWLICDVSPFYDSVSWMALLTCPCSDFTEIVDSIVRLWVVLIFTAYEQPLSV